MSDTQEKTKNVEVENVKNEKSGFADLYESTKKSSTRAMQVATGKSYKVTVINATESGIIVSFGGKKDGFIPAEEAEAEGVEYNPENYKAGVSFDAKIIENKEKKSSDVIYFSKKKIEQVAVDFEKYKEVLLQPEFKAVITGKVKGGLTTQVGPFKVFIPASQIKSRFVAEQDLDRYIGKELRLRAIKSNKDADQEGPIEISLRKTVYASQRVILEEEQAAADKAFYEFFVVGKKVQGKVTRIRDFGAFVKVNGFECLANISNLSYKRNVKPEEVVEVGKTYEFLILNVDKEKRQVSLGLKQLQKSLYELAQEKYPEGSIITGPIKSIKDFGVYVQIEDGVDGIVHVSEISRKYVKSPADIYKEGDVVTAKVMKFDVDKNKITLSIKALLPEEEETTDAEYAASKEKRAQKMSKKFDASETPKKRTIKKAKDEEEVQQSYTAQNDGKSSTSIGEMLKNKLGFKD